MARFSCYSPPRSSYQDGNDFRDYYIDLYKDHDLLQINSLPTDFWIQIDQEVYLWERFRSRVSFYSIADDRFIR